MKKIRKEVELMGSIQDCGNVVGLHGVYEDDAQVYVVMELCSGGDLERILEVRGYLVDVRHMLLSQLQMWCFNLSLSLFTFLAVLIWLLTCAGAWPFQ